MVRIFHSWFVFIYIFSVFIKTVYTQKIFFTMALPVHLLHRKACPENWYGNISGAIGEDNSWVRTAEYQYRHWGNTIGVAMLKKGSAGKFDHFWKMDVENNSNCLLFLNFITGSREVQSFLHPEKFFALVKKLPGLTVLIWLKRKLFM